jgi:hypothetical protein
MKRISILWALAALPCASASAAQTGSPPAAPQAQAVAGCQADCEMTPTGIRFFGGAVVVDLTPQQSLSSITPLPAARGGGYSAQLRVQNRGICGITVQRSEVPYDFVEANFERVVQTFHITNAQRLDFVERAGVGASGGETDDPVVTQKILYFRGGGRDFFVLKSCASSNRAASDELERAMTMGVYPDPRRPAQ